MCGRFTLSKPDKIEKRFKTENKLPLYEPSWNIAPSQMVPTITKNSPNKILLMKWGFVWSKKTEQGTINLRAETTKEKHFFRDFLLKKRCLIVGDSFYEWGEVDLEGKMEKHPFNFYLDDRALFGFAGIYNDLKDAEGKINYTCAILTCPPNSLVKKVHNRMPVIIKKENEDVWLDPSNSDFDQLFSLLKPYPQVNMKMHIVSKHVNNPRNNSKELIKDLKSV